MTETLRDIFARIEAHRASRRSAREPEKAKLRIYARKTHTQKEAHLARRAGRPRPQACELCGGRGWGRIAFDHCHASGKFRGWLGARCNTVLGAVNDDPALLLKLADYLRQHARAA